jgi:hypothetical protein
MNNLLVTGSNCASTMRRLDAYLDNQLAPEDFAGVSQHLGNCPACRQELDVRRRLRSRIQAAVKEQPVSSYLETRILANVRAQQRRSGWSAWRRQMSAVAAVLLVTAGTFVAYHVGHLRWTAASQEAFIASLSEHVAGIMSIGLREHVHCSVFRKYPKTPKPLEAVRQHLPQQYQPVLSLVTANVPKGFSVAVAHECGYADREVIHIGLRSSSKLMSVIITRKRSGDTFTSRDALPVLAAAGADIYTAGVQRFQIAGFESRDYLVYLVSDLPKDANSQIMVALGPQVRSLLDTMRG